MGLKRPFRCFTPCYKNRQCTQATTISIGLSIGWSKSSTINELWGCESAVDAACLRAGNFSHGGECRGSRPVLGRSQAARDLAAGRLPYLALSATISAWSQDNSNAEPGF